MREIDNVTQSPIRYEQITVGGLVLTLKWSFRAEFEADKFGVDVKQLFSALKKTNTGTLTGMLGMFAAMVSHNFIAAGKPVPSPEYWAGVFDTEEPEKWAEACAAIGKTLESKVKASAMKLRESTPNLEMQEPKLQ
jgi:hypothetical protein